MNILNINLIMEDALASLKRKTFDSDQSVCTSESVSLFERALALEKKRNLIMKQRHALENNKVDIFNKRVSSICSLLTAMKDSDLQPDDSEKKAFKQLMLKTLETYVQNYESTQEVTGVVDEEENQDFQQEESSMTTPLIQDRPCHNSIQHSNTSHDQPEITIRGEAISMKINLNQDDCKRIGKIAAKMYRLQHGKDPSQKQTPYGMSNLYTVNDREIIRKAIATHTKPASAQPEAATNSEITQFLTSNP